MRRSITKLFDDSDDLPPNRDDTTPKWIKEGWYPLTIVTYVQKQSGSMNGSYKYLLWTFQVNDLSVDPNFKLFTITSFNPKAQWRLLQFIDAVTGVKVVSGTVDVDFDMLIGKQLRGKVDNYTFNRETRSSVTLFKPLTP